MSKLSDLLLSSGFADPYFSGSDDERSMQALYDAILEALLSGGVLPEETVNQLLGDKADEEAGKRLEELIRQIMERMQESGYITPAPDPESSQARGEQGGTGGERARAPVEVRGHRQGHRLPRLSRAARSAGFARQEQLRPPRHARSGDRHRGLRRDEGLRVRRHAEPRRQRHGAQRRPRARARPSASDAIDVEYEDLVVVQGEYQSSCATVLMLDCSHSMILYGEDRFTPAKRVALALSQLIRHAVSRRHAEPRAVPRLGGGSAAQPARTREGRPLLHEHARRSAPRAPHPRAPAEGHAADHDDHRRQAVGPDAARRAHLPQRLRPRPAGRLRDAARGRKLPQGGDS